MRFLRTIPALSILAGALLCAALPAAAVEGLLLIAPGGAGWTDSRDAIEGAGGRLLFAFPPGGAVIEGPDSFWERIAGLRDDWTVRFDAIPESESAGFERTARFAAHAWNRRLSPPARGAHRAGEPGESRAGPAPAGDGGMMKAPPGGNFFDTSEFFLGTVAIAILLPESDGSIDPSTENWSAARIDSVIAEVQEGAAWWIGKAPGGRLSFVYEIPDPIPCPYEPISRNAFVAKQETLWVRTVFDSLGYASGDTWFRGRSYLNDVRDTHGADWAVAVFVADSENDPDGRFANSLIGFSYYGGPYHCMTYDCGSYGIGGMRAVEAHELAHNFYALDEYYSAHKGCALKAGYLYAENQNSEYGSCILDESCIMRDDLQAAYDSSAACVYTLAQVGMADDDEDGIADILDTHPSTLFDAFPDSTDDVTPTVGGAAEVNPRTNRNALGEGNDITLNTISAVQVRIDGGEWLVAQPADGVFDSTWEAFTFTAPAVTETAHVFEARAINSEGNADTVFAAETLLVYDGTPPSPVASPVAAALDSSVTLAWVAPEDGDYEAVMIRFGTAAYPADTLDGFLLERRAGAPGEPDTTIHAGLFPDTTYYYAFFSLDEASNPSARAEATATPLYPLPPAALLAPPAGSLYVEIETDFLWSAIPLDDPLDTLIAYAVQIARDSLFTDVLVDSEATAGSPADTFWTCAGLPEGTILWWRARGLDVLSGTWGLWGVGSRFATRLPLAGIAFLDSTLSGYTNFADGDSLLPNEDARVEVRIEPADTLDIGGFAGWVRWEGTTTDSAPLALDRNEGGYGYWRGEIPYGTAFHRGDTVSFYVSAGAPYQAGLRDKNAGDDYAFTAGRSKLAALHVPEQTDPYVPMRYPFIPSDADPSITLTIRAEPSGNVTGGAAVLRVAGDPNYSLFPVLSDTLIGGVDYLTVLVDSTFDVDDVVEYYLRVWGDPSLWDTTFLYGTNDTSRTASVEASAAGAPFTFLVHSVTGLPAAGDGLLPSRNELLPNAPNPFNPTTTLSFALTRAERVSLALFDVRGRLVRVLMDDARPPGWHEIAWNGLDGGGKEAPSGVYFSVLRGNGWNQTRKIVLIR
ncbi:MAG: hypothetical protein JW958_05860 [Candidatus Eisenbacteria bacterium]|nr:hypothetical protein [Candidatus Eisenbacteria bacterium]